MNKLGLIILLGSLAAAAFLLLVWFVGFLIHVGGGLIHLLLLLAIVVGFIGSIAGLIVMVTGTKTKGTS